MSNYVLNHKIISGCIAGTDDGQQNSKIALAIAIVMAIFGVLGLLLPGGIVYLTFCWAFAGLCLFMRKASTRNIHVINKKAYTIREDRCLRKYTSVSVDGPNSYYFVLEGRGRTELHFPHAIFNSTAVIRSGDLYESTDSGDRVYLLLNEKNKVLYIFNCNLWAIDPDEFTKTEDLYIPKN